jgi:GDP/UDP-N,N'-diacetylbacillosamine 2-epimerase (hydrolysing)
MTRRVLYVTGSRADFGLMLSTLRMAADHPSLDLGVCVTGMHLSDLFGSTETEVESSGLAIVAKLKVDVERGDGASMARGIAQALAGMVDVFVAHRPDIVLLLGDRGEMLAGAIAALHLNILIAHIHGGERSGTVDEPVRHAISKLAHFHFVATQDARERLLRMGERESSVHVTGAPGLDGLTEVADIGRDILCRSAGLDPSRPVALVVFHPVVQEAEMAGAQVREVISAVVAAGLQAICLLPNSDAGSTGIRGEVLAWSDVPGVRVVKHLARREFASWLRAAEVMVGNSSSGIIEAATFDLPVVNVGSRQQGRARCENVIDSGTGRDELFSAIGCAMARGRVSVKNIYGDGRAGERIVSLLAGLSLDCGQLMKTNAY